MGHASLRKKSRNSIPVSRRFFRRVRSALLRHEFLYRWVLRRKFGRDRLEHLPQTALPNGVLKTRAEWEKASERARALGLPLHRGAVKNWDHVAAILAIANRVPATGRVLDAGAELYSNVLPGLYICGFRDLVGINLAFRDQARRGPIRYLPGDITATEFPDASFDAVTCMSVIEHGVPLEAYFREMHRVLKPGGLLITSTDYFPERIDTGGLTAYGSDVIVYDREQAREILALAARCGFEQTGEIDLECEQRPVSWDEYGLEFTFLIFTLRKRP